MTVHVINFLLLLLLFLFIIIALHGMQTRSSDENSVCLSVTRVHCDKAVERSVQIYILFSLVF